MYAVRWRSHRLMYKPVLFSPTMRKVPDDAPLRALDYVRECFTVVEGTMRRIVDLGFKSMFEKKAPEGPLSFFAPTVESLQKGLEQELQDVADALVFCLE